MKVNTIHAQVRTARGSNQVRRVRQSGLVPAVVYGTGAEPESISLPQDEVQRELRLHHRVFQVEIAGKRTPVYLQAVQYDALNDDPLHLDLLRIAMSEALQLEVQLMFIGVPVGASKGGNLIRDTHKLAVRSSPDAIPHEIEVRVAGLDVGGELRAGDVQLPEGTTLDCPANLLVCHVAAG